MITIIHGGQTGVDRGAHDSALANGWQISGFMPRGGYDELGRIPTAVTRYLQEHDKYGYAARTEANVRLSGGLLAIVQSERNPFDTPGTSLTLNFAKRLNKPLKIVSPSTDPSKIVDWLQERLHSPVQLTLTGQLPAANIRLMIAGPREGNWAGARAKTVELLRSVALLLADKPVYTYS